MKKLLFVLLIVFGFIVKSFSQNGDTITVQTFTFGSPQDAWFEFPSDTIRFEKILMLYKLKCNPAQNPACGEWDYSTFTYLYDHTGLIDSSVVHQPVFLVNGNVVDTIHYTHTPTYSYIPNWQYYIVHNDTVTIHTFQSGNGSLQSTQPFASTLPVSRTQYLWRASELTSAGLVSGDITGLRFNIQNTGSMLQHLVVRMKHTAFDSLSQSNFNTSGFTEVYNMNTGFIVGWNSLQFLTPFFWDGMSNIIVEICYDNGSSGTDNIVLADNVAFSAGLYKSGDDRCLQIQNGGHAIVAINDSLMAIDSLITVSFWAYGDSFLQPQSGTCFEAIHSNGNRVINAHVPWSDSNIYWDAGNDGGSYDRIYKAASSDNIKGKWNYWAFTKNAASGSMKIYLNGDLWHSGTGKIRPMTQMNSFVIGKGNWSGSASYEGRMDEFSVFNIELDEASIEENMNNEIGVSNPYYNNLLLYYKFNDNSFAFVTDSSSVAGHDGYLMSAGNPLKSADDYIYGFTETTLRPNVIFEQGIFNSQIDSIFVLDSVANLPVQIVMYSDSMNNPGVSVDTLMVWNAGYYNDVYDANGIVIDSVFVYPDSTMILTYYDYYIKFPQVIRYELARYITPYGNGLSLGDGWTWTFDVTDYRTLLADSVHIAAGNWQELLDIKFVMIKGVPPRDVISIQNLWNGSFEYGKDYNPIENHLTPKTIYIPANVQTVRWKSRVTGHGMDTPSNCAEFCAKSHYYKVDGIQQFSKLVWRDNCDLNPLYPQGGTWVYDRANWCPGAEVWTYDFELTPFISPGDSVTLQHAVQAYTSTGGWNHYDIEDQLVTYGAPNFSLDAAIENVLSPSEDQMWKRINPICKQPVVIIKNNGTTDLNALTITYGITGGVQSEYEWTGNLKFLETETIQLDTFAWMQGASTFTVSISNPNGGTDEYVYNNTRVTPFTYVAVMPPSFYIEFKTNNYPSQNAYELKDNSGNIVFSRSGLTANTFYKDTLDLPVGCYEFKLTDSGEDGLTWWANTAQGSGYIRFRSVESPLILKNFNSDFGGEVYMQFTVGLTNNTEDYIFVSHPELNVYPNPSSDKVYIDFDLPSRESGVIEIHDVMGKCIQSISFSDRIADSFILNISTFETGVYVVSLKTLNYSASKRLLCIPE